MNAMPVAALQVGQELASSDADLIALTAKGDSRALGALFDRYSKDVYRFAARLTGYQADDLDDLVQNTFIALAGCAKRYRGDSSVKSWLFGIAANACRHDRRSRARRGRVLALTRRVPHDVQAPTASPHQIVESRELLVRLRAALSVLPDPLREVFVACVIEGLPGPEVARALGIPEGTLWRRLHDARLALAATFKETT